MLAPKEADLEPIPVPDEIISKKMIMSDTLIAITSALRRTVETLEEFRTTTSKSFNPSDIDEICDNGHNLLEEIEMSANEGSATVEITWQDVQQAFPSLSKEDCVEFIIINRSDIVARMKDAALKSILERGVNN
jgi:hypothetical protein